jgi:hypothetical protein
LLSGFVKFLQNIKKSPKITAQFMVQKVFHKWRVNLIKEIVNINQHVLEITPYDEVDSFFNSEQLTDILNFVSIS